MARGALARRLALGAACSALLALAALWLFYTGRLRFNHPDPARYPVRGIDVSRHQGLIRWDLAAADGVSFAFIKASEGGDWRDKRFAENWSGAARAGIPAGPYHFFTFCRDGAAQAENFLGAIAAAAGPMLPPALDLEFVGNCSKRPAVETLRDELRDFAGRVERELGTPPVYYVTREFMTAYADAMPEGAEYWVRSVFTRPGRTFGRPWLYWQFADHGRVNGVRGPVDLNVFGGSRKDWEGYLARRRTYLDSPVGR